MAAKKEKAAAAKKTETKSSMAFIREAVTAKPAIELKALVKAVSKAGYSTKPQSIRQEYLKTRRALAREPVKKVEKPVEKKQAGKEPVAEVKSTPPTPQAKKSGKGGKVEDESCAGLTEKEDA